MPYPLRTHKRALKKFGVEVELAGGRHPYKAVQAGRPRYPIAVHNTGDELDDAYIRALCRNFGIDEADYRAELAGMPWPSLRRAAECTADEPSEAN